MDCLEQIAEVLLRCWLVHSQGVRLSILETVSDTQRWEQLKAFIERYGNDLFTQWFMNLGNLRGILHEGVQEYLEALIEDPDPDEEYRLIREIDSAIPRDEAAYWLSVTIEAVVENYSEYIDYNSITTQSDRGEMLYTLLDFLRLGANYDRLAWNLRPVVLAHDVLVRSGREKAADLWRSAVAERTAPIADEHLRRFDRLCKKYGMQLPSIAEHLGERFVQPLEIDQLCALLRPAINEIRDGRPSEKIRQLEEHIARFTEHPSGAGFELPEWLESLEQEMDRVQWESDEMNDDPMLLDPLINLPQRRLSWNETQLQIKQMLDNSDG
jgi:DNA-binding transcriptional MerR regulator